MIELLEDLNAQQKEAVLHFDGPCMVLAGAGSGKTRVLAHRMAYLISRGVETNSILAITFTNKAAKEMRHRVEELVPDFDGYWIHTFHAACYRILRMDIHHLGYERNFNIVDEADCKMLMKEILKEEDDYETKPEEILHAIKGAKNSLQDVQKYFESIKLSPAVQEKYYRMYRIYNARLKEFNALDFEDLIVLCIKLFKDYPEVLEKYQNWFQYIMIDEYQDTNYPQYIWAKMLAARHNNIFVVGDPDQSIYSWRGAEPYNVQRFLDDYPQTHMVKLLTNYRSTRCIIAAANAVIKNNTDREKKELTTIKDLGDLITCYSAADSFQEAQFVADSIADMVDRGNRHYNDFAVFYRTHAQSRILEEAMVRRFISYEIVGARRFYERKEIKDLIAYLRLIVNGRDRLSFRRIINIPKRGIGEKSIEKIENYAAEQELNILDALEQAEDIPGIGKKMTAQLQEFYEMIIDFRALNDSGEALRNIIDQVLERSGYLEDLERNNSVEAQARIENLQEFRSLAIEFEKEGGEGLEDFLARIALVQDSDDVDATESVQLMTYHGAKGLEFPVVFMTGMEEGVFPSYKAETKEEMEEERRLCYVGITRACEKLILTNTVSRLLYGYERNNPPSRFLQEIPSDLIRKPGHRERKGGNIEEGDRVLHRKFGAGMVLSIVEEETEELAVVEFDRAGTRTLRLDIAPLEKIS